MDVMAIMKYSTIPVLRHPWKNVQFSVQAVVINCPLSQFSSFALASSKLLIIEV